MNSKKLKRKVILDWVLTAVLCVALVICFVVDKLSACNWTCGYDTPVLVIAIIVGVAGCVMVQLQNKKIKKALPSEENA